MNKKEELHEKKIKMHKINYYNYASQKSEGTLCCAAREKKKYFFKLFFT